MTAALFAALLGLGMGLRHAFEPDHVTAVATMVARERSARSTLRYAAAWGAGHAAILVLVACVLVALRAQMPERLSLAFEIAVGVVLVALGVRALSPSKDEHAHHHGRPFAVGVVHGLAGSGALTALALAQTPDPRAAIGSVALYGVGAIVGMSLLAGAAGPLLARASRAPRVRRGLVLVAGLGSVAFGLFWGVKSALALVQL